MPSEPSDPPGLPASQVTFGSNGPERTPARSLAPSVVVAAGGLLLAVISFFFAGDASGIAIAGVVLVALGVSRAISWSVRRYEITTEEVRVTAGLLERTSSVVPYSRVQQVDLNASLLQRAFGLTTVHIGTAGASDSAEITIDALSPPQAEHVRRVILERRRLAQLAPGESAGDAPGPVAAAEAAGPPVDEEATPALTLDAGRLALAGATGASIWLGVAALFGAVFVALSTIGTEGSDLVDVASAASAVVLVMLGLGLLFGLPLLGAGYALLTYGNFRLWVTPEHVRASYGLLSQRRLTVPRRRVQMVTVADNPVRRWLGMASATVQSASASRSGDSRSESSLSVPLLNQEELDWLVTASVGLDRPPLTRRPEAARGRAIRRRLWPPLVLGLVATVVLALVGAPGGVVVAVVLAAVLLCVAAFPWGRASYQRGGYAVSGAGLALGSGVLTHTTWHVPLVRVQSAGTSQSWFQRRRQLASLRVDVAGAARAPQLRDMGEDTSTSMARTLPLSRR